MEAPHADDDFQQITRYNSKMLTVASVVSLSLVASLSHSASTFVCSTFAVMQRVAWVRQRQLIFVKLILSRKHSPVFFGQAERSDSI